MVYFILKIAGYIAIFQMFLLILFFNNKRNRNTSNYLLSLILLVYTMQLCAIEFMFSASYDVVFKYNILPALFNQFTLAFGPLVWLYSKSLVDRKIKSWELLHFLPFVLVLLYMPGKKIMAPDYLFWMSSFRFYTSGLILLQSLIYLIATTYTILKNRRLYKEYFHQSASFQVISGFLLIGFIVLWVLKFNTFLFIDLWRNYGVCPITTSSYFVAGFLFFNILLYLALIKPELFMWKRKYQNTNISSEKKEQILGELMKFMEVDKLYTDSSITVITLAKKIGVPAFYLSQMINAEFHQGFPEFINGYRIREAKRLLLFNHSNFNIQQIMYEVGFNSKSAFNNAFKQYTGTTPTSIKQNLQYQNQRVDYKKFRKKGSDY